MTTLSRRQILAAAPAAAVAAASGDQGPRDLAMTPVDHLGTRAADAARRSYVSTSTLETEIRAQYERWQRVARGEPDDDDDGYTLKDGEFHASPEIAALRSVSPVIRQLMQTERAERRRVAARKGYAERMVERLKKKHPFLGALAW